MKADIVAERRAYLWQCIARYKMSNVEARNAVMQKFKMESYPWRSFRYDRLEIQKENLEKIKELAVNGVFEFFWGTVDSIRAQIQQLEIVASQANTAMEKIAARNSIIQAEVILSNLTSERAITGWNQLRLNRIAIIDVPSGVEAVEDKSDVAEDGTKL